MAQTFIILGLAFLLIGGVLYGAPGLLAWFGRLPGDIRYEGENVRVFVPITSMLILSGVASLLLALFRR